MFEKFEKIQKTCPVCGKVHTLMGYYHKHVWLDGQPKLPMIKFLARYAMCEHCGCVYHDDMPPSKHINDVVYSAEYQNIVHAHIDPALKKLLCMKQYQWGFGNVDVLLSHYYAETQQSGEEQQSLQAAIANIQNGTFEDTNIIRTEECTQFHVVKYMHLHADMYIIDLYRRANRLNEALQHIYTLRGRDYFGNPVNLLNYLKYEEDLIKAGKTQRY